MTSAERLAYLREGSSLDGVDCRTAAPHLGGGSSCELETAEFYYALCRREKFLRVVHTGTNFGFDSAFIASALKENGEGYPLLAGKIATVDSTDYGASKLWEKLGLSNCRQIVGDSLDLETYVRAGVEAPVDWFHADADHAGEALLAEFHVALHYLNRRRCFFSTHDSRLDPRLQPALRLIVAELKFERASGRGWTHIGWWPLRGLRGLDLIFLSNEELG